MLSTVSFYHSLAFLALLHSLKQGEKFAKEGVDKFTDFAYDMTQNESHKMRDSR